jgi:hypothetical protein
MTCISGCVSAHPKKRRQYPVLHALKRTSYPVLFVQYQVGGRSYNWRINPLELGVDSTTYIARTILALQVAVFQCGSQMWESIEIQA